MDEKHPAVIIMHWPTGPVFCCIEHGLKLQNLGRVMGIHVHVEPYSGDKQCENCANKGKDNG